MVNQERCRYCMPEVRTIMDNIGPLMLDEELRKSIDWIEAMGRVLYCGDTKEICEPLMLIQRQINKNERKP